MLHNVLPGLAISFPVQLSFIILPPLASKSVYCILLPRLCFPELSTREQMRGCSNSGLRCLLPVCLPGSLPGLLKTSPTVQMYDVYCGLASYGIYASDLVICVVMPFPTGLLLIRPASAFMGQ